MRLMTKRTDWSQSQLNSSCDAGGVLRGPFFIEVLMTLQTKFGIDESGELWHERTQDCAPVLKQVEQLRRAQSTKSELRTAARIPMAVLPALQKKLGIVDEFGQPKMTSMNKDELKRLYKELNSNEWKKLRIYEGKL